MIGFPRAGLVLGGLALSLVLAQQVSASTYSASVLAANPVAYWRLNDAAGSSSAADSVGGLHPAATNGGSDLTFNGTSQPVVSADPTSGSVDFNGFERLVTAGFNKIGTGGYSVEYWIDVKAYPTDCCAGIVGDGQAPGTFFLMNYLIGPGQGTTGTVRTHFGLENTPVATDSNAALALNTIHHVVSTWDTGTGKGSIYIDGVLDKQVNVTTNPPTAVDNALPIYLGRDDRENRPSKFLLGDVAIYDHALTAAQIQQHYNLGTQPVPEPSTYVLFGLGAVGLLLSARRRRRPVA